jgi:hypothetical protein
MNIKDIYFGTRSKSGFTFGVIATFVMTLIMLTGMQTGISPIPEPIPVAIIKSIFGTLSKPVLMILGMGAHFAYGGAAGFLLFKFSKDNKLWYGLIWGIMLWLIMHIVFLPLIGWGFFATAVNVKIIPATLLLHLIYGGILGYGLTRYKELVKRV